MGGNAITFAKRIYGREYRDSLIQDLVQELDPYFEFIEPVTELKGKTDFGDIDILVSKPKTSLPLKDIIEKVFTPQEIHKNSSIVSFDFYDHQIDVIQTKEKWIQSSKYYYSYNDLHNFIGKMVYPYNLRLGHYGLKYIYYYGDSKKLEVEVTNDFQEIYEFLGLDWKTYQQGFHGVEDLFTFIMSSPFFDWRAFQFDNLNHKNRTRNKKRKNFTALVEWIQKYEIDAVTEFEHPDAIKKIFWTWGDILVPEIEAFEKKMQLLEYVAAKFNGHIVMEITGLQGKELGNFISNLKKEFSDTSEFNNWVLNQSPKEIKNWIEASYHKTQNTK